METAKHQAEWWKGSQDAAQHSILQNGLNNLNIFKFDYKVLKEDHCGCVRQAVMHSGVEKQDKGRKCGLKAKELSWEEEKTAFCPATWSDMGKWFWKRGSKFTFPIECLKHRVSPSISLRLGHYNILQGGSKFQFCHVAFSTELPPTVLQASALSSKRSCKKWLLLPFTTMSFHQCGHSR